MPKFFLICGRNISVLDIYGADISESLISQITDDIIEDVKLWQSRPLDPVYAIVFFDCLVVKVGQDIANAERFLP